MKGVDVNVGLHQGSALSLCFFFTIVMDMMPDEIRQDDR